MSTTESSDKDVSKSENSLINLEKDIAKAVSDYNSWFQYEIEKEKIQKNDSNMSKPIQEAESNITLEKVAADMTDVLDNLKKNLAAFKLSDSFSDVAPQIEQMCKQRSKINNNINPHRTNNQNKNITKPINNQNKNANSNKSGSVNKVNSINKSQGGTSKRDSTVSANNNLQRPSAASSRNSSAKMQRPVSFQPSISLNDDTKTYYVSKFNNFDQLGTIKDEVQRAIRDRKTFTIKGCYPEIRRSLLRRGWIEKIHPSYRERFGEDLRKFQNHSIPELLHLLRNKDIAENCKKLVKSKLLINHQVDLFWSSNYEVYREVSDNKKLTKINKLRRGINSFTSKQGLSEAAQKSFALSQKSDISISHPRTYTLTKNGDAQGFINDFNITAAMSLLAWVKRNSMSRQCKIISPSGKVPVNVFDFAVAECYNFIKKVESKDISDQIPEALEQEWNYFLEHYYKTVHVGNHFKETEDVKENDMVRKATYILRKLRDIWPFLNMDGFMNIWILKPVNSSQGVGIHMCRTLKYILNVVRNNPNRSYVIQKYIERPLLIYNTKFDIRQWFLISSTVPLTMWMYKSCYLRFSSQTYNLRKLHESIHLTNNSVQCKYNKNISRDISLPTYNMWDSNQFKNYLSDIGYPKVFQEIIQPGMKECLVATILVHSNKLDKRKNTFELYGADFILTEDFRPWLLEINSNPALHASTPITARMCPQVLEDVIKVVVDYEANNRANTGGFELVYQATSPSAGGKHKEPVKVNNNASKNNIQINQKLSFAMSNLSLEHPIMCIRELGIGMRKTLEHLLEVVKKQRIRKESAISRGIDTFSCSGLRKNISIETVISLSQMEIHTQTSEQLLEINTFGSAEFDNEAKGNSANENAVSVEDYILRIL